MPSEKDRSRLNTIGIMAALIYAQELRGTVHGAAMVAKELMEEVEDQHDFNAYKD